MLDPRYDTFMLLEEWRRNRQVDPYPGELDKLVIKDKGMEIPNCFLDQFLKMRCRAGFVFQAIILQSLFVLILRRSSFMA